MALIKLKQYAENKGLSLSLLYKLTAKKRIPHYKPFGKLVFVDPEEVDDFIRQYRIDTDAEIKEKADSR